MSVVGGRDRAIVRNRRYAAQRFHLSLLLVFFPWTARDSEPGARRLSPIAEYATMVGFYAVMLQRRNHEVKKKSNRQQQLLVHGFLKRPAARR